MPVEDRLLMGRQIDEQKNDEHDSYRNFFVMGQITPFVSFDYSPIISPVLTTHFSLFVSHSSTPPLVVNLNDFLGTFNIALSSHKKAVLIQSLKEIEVRKCEW